MQVGLPYLAVKADRLHQRLQPNSGILGLALRGSASSIPTHTTNTNTTMPSSFISSLSCSVRRLLARSFLLSYPWVRAALQATQFSYQLGFLLGASPVHSPAIHALGIRMARVSPTDLARRQTVIHITPEFKFDFFSWRLTPTSHEPET